MGSTIPESWPYQKLLNRERPSRRKGMETAAPSGKFCRPIPKARAVAPERVAEGRPAAAAPKATPTARPSGMLWRVMAITSRRLRCQPVFTPSALEVGRSM